MDKTFKFSLIFLVVVFVGLLIFETMGGNSVDNDFLEKMVEGEVTVTAQPVVTDSGMEIFTSMDTHTVDLEEDLKETAYIEVDGNKYQPVEWIGDPSGGHHRSGSIIFEEEFNEFILHMTIGGENKKFNWK